MPNCSTMGPGWMQDGNGQCVYSASDPGALTVSSLDYGQELEGSTLKLDWQEYFDAYDPTKEDMLRRSSFTDIGQLGAAWDLESQQLGDQYQVQLGGLFEQAGAGTMDLMSSWGGGGQTMTGRKGRQRKRIGSEASRQAGAYGMGLGQARETGELQFAQAKTDIYQGLEADIYGERDKWRREQRSNLNTLLGMDIWRGTGNGTTFGDGQNDDNEFDFPNTSEQEPDYGDFWDDYEQPDLDLEGNPWNLIDPDCGDPGQQGNPACAWRFGGG